MLVALQDYGPVAMAKFKQSSRDVFDALSEGRRVLISRHGKIVASIEPATPTRHSDLLASYAVQGNALVSELSAAAIGQRSPAPFIHRAEHGDLSVLTKNNKVFGILTGPPSLDVTADDATRQERLLAAFIDEHPEASAEEFADYSESISVDADPVAATAEPVRSERVARMLVELAQVYSTEGRSGDALRAADSAVAHLRAMGEE